MIFQTEEVDFIEQMRKKYLATENQVEGPFQSEDSTTKVSLKKPTTKT
jgi:hypothetical protein